MAPVRPRKRKSGSSPTTSPQSNPIKKRKMGISTAQKQALIDNLQLEITERARRLRSQYNIQAQQLRSRVEMRVNRIPSTLRKLRMGEILAKSQKPQQTRPPKSPYVARPPPVPAKDGTSPKPIPRKPVPTSSAIARHKRLSDDIAGADKENQGDAVENPKKRPRGAAAKEAGVIQPGQVLSPTSSNTRILPRERPPSPTKPMVSRPASPMKAPTAQASSNILSNMVEKSKATQPAVTARKATTSSTASSNIGTTTTRTRRAVAMAAPSAAATRGRRKVSATSETSEASTATVVKKTTASRVTKAAPAAKRTVMGTIKSATTKKAPATKAAAAPPATGRTLRKRAA